MVRPTPLVGRSLPRTDAYDKVTGRARYVADLTRPDMLHGGCVRSPIPRGRILKIVYDADFDWTGVTVVDHRGIPGNNAVPLIDRKQPVLAEREVRHRYEPIVLLAAEDPEHLAAALAHVSLELDSRPMVGDIEDSLEASIKLFGENNVFKEIKILKGDPDRALAEAVHQIEEIYEVSRQEHVYIEPQGMLAEPQPDGGMLVTGSLQCPWYVHRAVCEVLGIDDKHRVRVVQAETGGGFGGKEEYPSLLAAHAALLAQASGRPVRMIYSRVEDMAATPKRHPGEVVVRAGIDAEARLVAMDIDVLLDGGAYMTLSPVVLSRAVLHATSAYRVPNVSVRGRVVATNTPPSGAFRGFGAPQTIFACERAMDHLAACAGISPAEIRRRNLLEIGDETSTGQVLHESVSAKEVLECLVREHDYEARHLAIEAEPLATRRRGIGLATWMHGCGFTGSGETDLDSRVTVRLTLDPSSPVGARADVLSAAAEIGQGASTTFRQIAADALGMPLQCIRVPAPDTAAAPDSGPTVASRTCMIVGGLVQRAAEEIRRQLEAQPTASAEVAARLMDAGGELEATAHHEPKGDQPWDDDNYRGAAYAAHGFAAVLVEVDVDPVTYEVQILDVATCQDVGRAIHPVIVEGQIQGGTAQALGWASIEEVVMEDGAMRNLRLCDYQIPTAEDLPPIHVHIHESPFSGGAFGAKGVGEMPIDGPAAAFAAAVCQATGLELHRLPITPERLVEALIAMGGDDA